jgi:hypothetical protein
VSVEQLRGEHRWFLFASVSKSEVGTSLNYINRIFLKFHNEERQNLYSTPNIIGMFKPRTMRWAGYVVHMGGKENTYRIVVRRPLGKTPRGRLAERESILK